jgi:hypothetical protein
VNNPHYFYIFEYQLNSYDRTMKGIDQEAGETGEMAGSFFRLLEHKLKLNERTDPPGKEEVKAAVIEGL